MASDSVIDICKYLIHAFFIWAMIKKELWTLISNCDWRILRFLINFVKVNKNLVLATYEACTRVKPTYNLGVKVRNMKMDYNTGDTWRRVGQWTLMMKINDFFIRVSRLVALYNNMLKIFHLHDDFYILYFFGW